MDSYRADVGLRHYFTITFHNGFAKHVKSHGTNCTKQPGDEVGRYQISPSGLYAKCKLNDRMHLPMAREISIKAARNPVFNLFFMTFSSSW